MKFFTAEFMNSVTPIVIAAIGGIIGVSALFIEDNDKTSSAMGLAGTAIAGAAGLAQSSRGESTISGPDRISTQSEALKTRTR